MGRAFAYAAVGEHLAVGCEAPAPIQVPKVPVPSDRRRPGHIDRAWDVAAALGALLGPILGRQQLAEYSFGDQTSTSPTRPRCDCTVSR